MVKIIELKEENCISDEKAESYLGKFVDPDAFDQLVTEDADVYKPLPPFQSSNGESNLLLRFRKGVFPPDVLSDAYAGLIDGATASNNRGHAAGPRGEYQNSDPSNPGSGRQWVTALQFSVLEYFMQPANAKLFDDENELEKIIKKNSAISNSEFNRGFVWKSIPVKENNFIFEDWMNKVRNLPKDQQITEARWVMEELVSATVYAAPVFSGLAGYFDRYTRIPYCRETSYTTHHKEQYQKAIPFIEAISDQFQKLIPGRYQNQLREIEKIDPKFRIGRSVYTTLTLNRNFRTAGHRDAGDLPNGFGNLVTLSNKNQWQGGYLCFPKYRVAVDVRPGDMLAMDVHEIHGNTPLSGENHERMSVVCYFREKMSECSLKAIEDLRHKFVEVSRLDTANPFYRTGWNGVWPGMFESVAWSDYLRNNGFDDEASKVLGEQGSTLEDLF